MTVIGLTHVHAPTGPIAPDKRRRGALGLGLAEWVRGGDDSDRASTCTCPNWAKRS